MRANTAIARTAQKSSVGAVGTSLGEENLVLDRLYAEVIGHSFTRREPDPGQRLGACTGDRAFRDVLPRGATTIGSRLVGENEVESFEVVEQLAQTGSPQAARATAEEIVSLVERCVANQGGGDFGYSGAVTVIREADRKVDYFPAFDSDRAYGGYVVFSVGARVGVLEVADLVNQPKLVRLADEALTIAAY